jgi:hypothetical protein
VRGRASLLALALVAAGCGASHTAAPPPVRTGPSGVVRVALSGLRWPLDPALAATRDETALARVVYSTPLRVDDRGRLRAGLCTRFWSADGFRRWRFRCRHAGAIAAELRRVAALQESASQWLFADASRIEARGPELSVELSHPWRRFPYALTAVAAAPRGVPGPFRVVSASRRRVVAARPRLRLVFTKLAPHAAAVAFRRGQVDEAPVPLGDLEAVRLDPALAGEVRARPLLAVDLFGFRMRGGPLADLPNTRRAYWLNADRQDYEALVPERAATAAYGLLPGGSSRGGAAAARAARSQIPSLPPTAVPVLVSRDPDRVYAAQLAISQWRELGLGPLVRPVREFERNLAAGAPTAWFDRVTATYPLSEALFGRLLLTRDGRNPWLAAGSQPERLLRRALAARNEDRLLRRADARLQAESAVVPLAYVVDARLVSRRLRGWRQDALGAVDYARVRAPAASPRR